jgi:hypothetical protein
MSNSLKTAKSTRRVDAWATVFLIILVAAGSIFWSLHV